MELNLIKRLFSTNLITSEHAQMFYSGLPGLQTVHVLFGTIFSYRAFCEYVWGYMGT